MDRYNRNILIEGFGEEGQEKLKNARVLVIGAGGLGSPVLLYLAAAGVGTLGIVDYDSVDITNLQRQIIHFTTDLTKLKVKSAAEKLLRLQPEINLHLHPEAFTGQNAMDLIRAYDFIVDCSDNFDTKFLINDTCVQLQKPYSHGSVVALRGEVMTYLPGHACYRCVFDSPPEASFTVTSSQVGILGSIAGIIGSIQATEVIKYLTDIGNLLTDRLLIIDGVTMNFLPLSIEKNNKCQCHK